MRGDERFKGMLIKVVEGEKIKIFDARVSS